MSDTQMEKKLAVKKKKKKGHEHERISNFVLSKICSIVPWGPIHMSVKGERSYKLFITLQRARENPF